MLDIQLEKLLSIKEGRGGWLCVIFFPFIFFFGFFGGGGGVVYRLLSNSIYFLSLCYFSESVTLFVYHIEEAIVCTFAFFGDMCHVSWQGFLLQHI